MKRLTLSLALLVGLSSFGASAVENAPTIKLLPAQYSMLSNNGKWAVSQRASETDGSIAPSGGSIINIETFKEEVISHESGLSGVADVTDDGNIVVGECTGLPAYWSREKGGWVTLEVPEGYNAGRLNAVTPDGHYGVGYVVPEDYDWGAYPIMYDLTTNKRIELPGLPKLDMTHLDQRQNCIFHISPDGRYLVGMLSVSYILPPSLCTYVYDRENATYKMIGFTESDTSAWKPTVDNVYFVDSPTMSPNGEWVTGSVYMVEESAGTGFPNEYRATYLYNIPKDEFKVYNKSGENDIVGAGVLNDGTVIGSTPSGNPYASTMIRSGNYFKALDDIFKQIYNINIADYTGASNTGYVWCPSDDGMTWIMGYSPEDSYLLTLKEPITEAAEKVKLLGNYTVSPASGTIMSTLTEVRVTFDREVETNGLYSKIKCVSEDGEDSWTPLQSGGWVADEKSVRITFRPRDLRKGVKYTLTIPEGLVRLKGDRESTSSEIKIEYVGRGADAVALTEAYPANDATVAGIDLTSNPVLLTFDADLKLADEHVAYLYRVGESAPYCTLNVLAKGKQLLLYPTSGQHLFNGTDYKIVVPAGIVTDLSGNGANEEITLLYHGSYVREVSSDDKIIFSSTCSDYDAFIFYEGDHLQPDRVPSSWGFTADNPWILVRSSDDSSDTCLAAHSMFSNGGTADDWMSTPQLYIPDEDCYLRFDAQSYRKTSTDRLKVYVYASKNVYDTFTEKIVEDIRANGEVIYDEVLSPGDSEEDLEGDWQEVTLPLAKYAGQDIYIAFVNDNTDGSAVFVDNVQVIHDLHFMTSFETPSRVVMLESVPVKGSIVIASEVDVYNSVQLVLKDAEGNEVDRITESGLNLAKDDVYPFAFAKELPLTIGAVNKFVVEATLNDYTSGIQGEVRDLTFEPVKHIVLEEYSGATCGNCPLGFVALENLEKLYPENIIPIILRTYNGDPLTSGLGGYTQFLGFMGAPSAVINRTYMAFPMASNGDDYMLSGDGYFDDTTGEPITTWLDIVEDEVAIPADAEIGFSSSYQENDKNIEVNFEMRNALNLENSSINVFAVITENKLVTYQENYRANTEDPDLGEWGKGGKYGTSMIYPFEINQVARGAYGTTFNGTGGLIPAKIEAGKIYTGKLSIPMPSAVTKPENCDMTLMLIDAASGKVLNANRCPLNGSTSGVKNVTMDQQNAPVIVAFNGKVAVRANGSAVTAQAYDINGRTLGIATADDTAVINLNGYTGVVIVKAVTADGVQTAAKLVVR